MNTLFNLLSTTVLSTALLATGCDSGASPSEPDAPRPADSIDVLPEDLQEVVYETLDKAEGDGPQFRATCSAKGKSGSVSVEADHCTCQDYVGC